MDYEKKYKESFERAKEKYTTCYSPALLEYIFPELKENKDIEIKKDIISNLKRYVNCIKDGYDTSSAKDFVVKEIEKQIAWLEKQGKQEQLYIRFGEIPTDEKSKIFRGEIEVGTENGVSVYPAFKTSEGDIVLGLSLPITKTTLYTQQHLIEYDDRPCYLVTGDYIGKDTDGQPLINNVSIIEKIDTYRVKEKMQSEQKVRCTALMETGNGGIKALVTRELPINSCDDEQKPADEPKFHTGDWIVNNLKKDVFLIKSINDGYYTLEDIKGNIISPCLSPCETEAHLWTIQDAKEGDVLVCKGKIKRSKIKYERICLFNNLDNAFFTLTKTSNHAEEYSVDVNIDYPDNTVPATKKQKEILFMAMADAGYTFDFKNKEFKKIETEIEIPFGAKDSELQQATYNIPKGFYAEIKDDKVVIKKGEKLTTWSEDDERIKKRLINLVNEVYDNTNYITFLEHKELLTWLEKLDDNVEL